MKMIALLAAPLLVAAAPGEVRLLETPSHTVFAYDPASLIVTNGPDGEVRRATIIAHNPVRPGSSEQVGARGTMEFACAPLAYRQVQTVSIGADGTEQVVVPADPARKFSGTRPDSFERSLVEAMCAVQP